MAATACMIGAALAAVQIHTVRVQAEHGGVLAAYQERGAPGCAGTFASAGALGSGARIVQERSRRRGLTARPSSLNHGCSMARRLRVCVHIARGQAERCAGTTCLCLHCTWVFASRSDSTFLFALGLCSCIAQGLRGCIHIAWGAKALGASVFPFGSFEEGVAGCIFAFAARGCSLRGGAKPVGAGKFTSTSCGHSH